MGASAHLVKHQHENTVWRRRKNIGIPKDVIDDRYSPTRKNKADKSDVIGLLRLYVTSRTVSRKKANNRRTWIRSESKGIQQNRKPSPMIYRSQTRKVARCTLMIGHLHVCCSSIDGNFTFFKTKKKNVNLGICMMLVSEDDSF
jgi:hypothetical protein